mgnify:CR=1 FL=1
MVVAKQFHEMLEMSVPGVTTMHIKTVKNIPLTVFLHINLSYLFIIPIQGF